MKAFRRIILFSLLFPLVFNFEFKDPQNDYIVFGDNSGGIQQLSMDENNPADIIVVLVTGATSDLSLTFSDGDIKLFDPYIEKQDDDYAIYVGKQIDYESLVNKRFLVQVSEKNNNFKMFNLQINNLDDESPSITTSICKMKENTTIDIDSANCSYTVTDADGFLNEMTYTIVPNTGIDEDQIFKFQYKSPPAYNVYSADVYLVLQDNQILDYEERTLYIFQLEAQDSGGNPTYPLSSVQVVVEVEDIPDEPPMWTNYLFTRSFDEEQPQIFNVLARDGDIGINNPIKYKVDDKTGFVQINADTGEIKVKAIDRDKGYDSITFTVTAYEAPDESSESSLDVTFIINDIDDNWPEISIPGTDQQSIELDIEENASGSLETVITIQDIDMGNNAMYTVLLQNAKTINHVAAFQVIPNRGYQTSNFSIAIMDSSLLDYEESDWKTINFELVAVGDLDENKRNTMPITINLIDINDESPIFENDGIYTVEIPENTTIDTELITVTATDRDADDVVTYEFLSTAIQTILAIDSESGNIRTIADNAFDYERQTEVYVQILARDLVDHTALAQLTISITDVNDENPVISVSSSVNVEENREDGYILDVIVTATDEDTTADLYFTIDWSASYATKNSIKLTENEFAKARCINVETVKDPTNNKRASANLTLIELTKDNTPDYELFDTLFVYLEVRDDNTEIGQGTDSAMILINIENINDNAPTFTDIAIKTNRSVNENSNAGTYVGTVPATDVDNMGDLIYSIEPTNDETPDWIEIDDTGSLSVKEDVTLDCDDPQIFYLDYTVNVYDGDFNTTLNISIYVIDQNDNKPTMSIDRQEIYENTENGEVIYVFDAKDNDRDAPYNVVEYKFHTSSTTDVTNRFKIVGDNLTVNLINSATLDRDHGLSEFACRITFYDNPESLGSIQNTNDVEFDIVLLDLNDEIPYVTTESISTREDLLKGVEIEEKILAIDYDEPDTNNSKIAFEIMSIERYTDEDFQTEVNVSQTLFDIITDEEFKTQEAILITNEDLKGYYGYYKLNIMTSDFGEPQQINSDNTVKLIVKKFNFKKPIFTFPEEGKTYYLMTEQIIKYQLYLYNGESFPNIKATDQQDDKYDIKFTLKPETDDDNIFQINDGAFGKSTGQLQLTTANFDTNRLYQLTITANIDPTSTQSSDEEPYTVDVAFSIRFFDITSDPTFDYTEMNDRFTEGQQGFDEMVKIKSASYPNGVEIPDLSIYYFLKNGNDELFDVDMNTGTITLRRELDYETETEHRLVIQASKNKEINNEASDNSQITVVISVLNINDNPPKFDDDYFGCIMTSYLRGTVIITTHATDPDGDLDPLIYSIDKNSMEAIGNSISDIDNPFLINEANGDITLNFAVLINMNGYFTFDIIVADSNFTDTTSVKIYIITEDNRVNFRFENVLTKVQQESVNIANKLNEEFNYQSNIEKIEPDTTNTGVDLENQTIASVYFIDEKSNEPINRAVILNKVTDVSVFSRLRQAFLEHSLILMSFENTNQGLDNMEPILKAWLIGVSVVLGTLCIILLMMLLLKTRALNQRINNLSTTKFGSQESGLNRQGITAPTTNKHAIEGSNPVYNSPIDTKEIDQISTKSGDSDLIGVEDNPEFDYEVKQPHRD